jgi:hypothetical protein
MIRIFCKASLNTIKKCIERLEEKLAIHRDHLDLAEKEMARLEAVDNQLQRFGVVPNK